MMCETIGEVDFQKLKEADPKWFYGIFRQHQSDFSSHHPVRYSRGV